MSLFLALLIGVALGSITLSQFGWSAVLFVASLLFVGELIGDVRWGSGGVNR